MDERTRKLERSAAAGDRLALVKLAHERLRREDPDGALATLGEADASDPELLACEAPVRSHALARLGRLDEALDALTRAADASGEAIDASGIAPVLDLALEGRCVLGRPRAARIVSRLRASDPVVERMRGSLAGDPDPLVRLAQVRERPAFDVNRDRSARVYGSHGADYEMGLFVVFEMCLEHRIRFFEPRVCSAVNGALAALVDDATDVEALELRTAYGSGNEACGLGGAHQVRDGGAALERAVDRLNALDLLPWKLRPCGVRPYDLMEDEERLARYLARDIGGHPATQKAPEQAANPIERFFALHPLSSRQRREPVPPDVLESLRAMVSPVGLRALELFSKGWHARTKF